MSFAKEVPDSDQTFTVDPYQRLQIQPNPDGSITRKFNFFPDVPPSCDPKLPVLSKDIPINQSNNTWLRLYLPRHVLDQPSTTSPTIKLPLVVFFHGGGFILFSAASKNSHDFCFNFAAEVPVVIASIDYRLAPEHRLPAAYDDAMESLQWIKTSQDDWLRDHADLSNCFLMGSSAGANIAYHAGLRVAAQGVDLLHPLKIRGLIFTQPFFGGIRRTDSEMRMVNDPVVVPSVTDLMWDLSLPLGVDRDHEYCNPTVGNVSNRLDQVKALGWRVLLTGCDGDPLIDRQSVLVKMLEDNDVVEVVSHVSEGGHHGILYSDLSKAKLFYLLVKQFMFA